MCPSSVKCVFLFYGFLKDVILTSGAADVEA